MYIAFCWPSCHGAEHKKEAYYSVQLAMARVLLIVICGGGLRHCVSITDTVCCGSCSDTSEVLFYVRSSGDHLCGLLLAMYAVL